jgi:hypothetical protein
VGAKRFCAVAQSKAGSVGAGSPRGSPPKRVPIVSTGSAKRPTASPDTASTTIVAGSLAVR